MCGIAGWVNLKQSKDSPDNRESVLHSMCETIVHREIRVSTKLVPLEK